MTDLKIQAKQGCPTTLAQFRSHVSMKSLSQAFFHRLQLLPPSAVMLIMGYKNLIFSFSKELIQSIKEAQKKKKKRKKNFHLGIAVKDSREKIYTEFAYY